jgi:hypothetical protein
MFILFLFSATAQAGKTRSSYKSGNPINPGSDDHPRIHRSPFHNLPKKSAGCTTLFF